MEPGERPDAPKRLVRGRRMEQAVLALLQHPIPWRTIFKPGLWTFEELSAMVPRLVEGIANPAPPPEEMEVPGRAKPEPQPTA